MVAPGAGPTNVGTEPGVYGHTPNLKAREAGDGNTWTPEDVRRDQMTLPGLKACMRLSHHGSPSPPTGAYGVFCVRLPRVPLRSTRGFYESPLFVKPGLLSLADGV